MDVFHAIDIDNFYRFFHPKMRIKNEEMILKSIATRMIR